MSSIKKLTLFGDQASRERARVLFENHPKVRRVDSLDNNAQLKLLLSSFITESELLSLISESGVSGVQIAK